jgi:tetratricopeptide (TPR) repeat protein
VTDAVKIRRKIGRAASKCNKIARDGEWEEPRTSMRGSTRTWVVVMAMLAPLLLGAVAHAQSDDAVARARSHFEAGRALYNLKQYTDAIREFSAGYQLVPKPQFLVNLGQCYDRLGDGTQDPTARREALEHARDMYKKFLDDAPPKDPLRDQVTGIFADLEKRLAALPAPAPKPVEPAPKPVEPTPVVAPVSTAPANNSDNGPKKKSAIARFWWIIPVAAVVVVGVSLGAYYGTRPSGPNCGSATYGCIDASKMSLIQY